MAFFIALFGCIAVPTLLSRILRIDKVFPLVFVQLLLGFALKLSGMHEWLSGQGIDLLNGPLSDSLSGLGMLGLSLLIALTGSETASQDVDRRSWHFVPISIIGFGGTCAIGTAIGYVLASHHPGLMGARANIWIFSCAIGLAISVTALPVLAAILREIGLSGTPLGNLATRCAMLDDLWMWLGLTTVLSVVKSAKADPRIMLLSLVVYVGAMLALRKWLQHWFAKAERPLSDRILLSISVILLSAVATDFIGLHAMLGTFMAGVILPRAAMAGWRDSLNHYSQIILLPFFFIMAGMRLRIDFHHADFLQLTMIVTLTAVLSKFGLVSLTARQLGFPWHKCLTLGSLMQCKGLMELVAIGILFEIGVIGIDVFSAMAMMALISTFVTAPMLRLLMRGERGTTSAAALGRL